MMSAVIKVLKAWWFFWTKMPLEAAFYTGAVVLVSVGVSLYLAWRWLTEGAREYEIEVKEKAQRKLREAQEEAERKIREADRYFAERRREIEEYRRQELLKIQATYEDKVGKWRKYIKDLEETIRRERERISKMKEEIRRASGALNQEPNLKYIRQRLRKALSI